MQAITTTYKDPTDSRGARIIAKSQAKRMTVAWDDGMSVDDNHMAAAMKLAEALEWKGSWIGGALPDGTGNVYVCCERAHEGAFSI